MGPRWLRVSVDGCDETMVDSSLLSSLAKAPRAAVSPAILADSSAAAAIDDAEHDDVDDADDDDDDGRHLVPSTLYQRRQLESGRKSARLI